MCFFQNANGVYQESCICITIAFSPNGNLKKRQTRNSMIALGIDVKCIFIIQCYLVSNTSCYLSAFNTALAVLNLAVFTVPLSYWQSHPPLSFLLKASK